MEVAMENTENGTLESKSQSKVKASHPSYKNMIMAALSTLQEKHGSSRLKILKFIVSQFKVEDENRANVHLKLALKKAIEDGSLVQATGNGVAGSFKIGEVAKKTQTKTKKPTQPKPKLVKQSGSKGKENGTALQNNSTKSKGKAARPVTKKAVAAKKPAATKQMVAKPKTVKQTKTSAKKNGETKTKTPSSVQNKKSAVRKTTNNSATTKPASSTKAKSTNAAASSKAKSTKATSSKAKSTKATSSKPTSPKATTSKASSSKATSSASKAKQTKVSKEKTTNTQAKKATAKPTNKQRKAAARK